MQQKCYYTTPITIIARTLVSSRTHWRTATLSLSLGGPAPRPASTSFFELVADEAVDANEEAVSEDSASPGTSAHALERHPHEPSTAKSSGADLNMVMLVPDALGQAMLKYARTLERGSRYELACRLFAGDAERKYVV